MKVTPLALQGVLLIEPRVIRDARGHFFEAWSLPRYREVGLPDFAQDNVSCSVRSTVRGLHLQHPHGQGKLISVLRGCVFDVVVDVRRGSPTFGRWLAEELSGENHRQLYVPPGFAHGFCVRSDHAHVIYKCTTLYSPSSELGIRFDDPDLDIPWRVSEPVLSPRDSSLPRLRDIDPNLLPSYAAGD